MMRSLIVGLALALAWGSVAYAVDLRQDSDGGATWVNRNQDSEVPAAEHHYTVTLEDLSTASTTYVTIPFSGGRLAAVYGVTDNSITGATEAITFSIGSDNQFTPVTPLVAEAASGTYELTFNLVDASTGDVSSVTYTYGSNSSLDIGSNEVIAIHTEGRSTLSTVNALITIVVH